MRIPYSKRDRFVTTGAKSHPNLPSILFGVHNAYERADRAVQRDMISASVHLQTAEFVVPWGQAEDRVLNYSKSDLNPAFENVRAVSLTSEDIR